MNTLKHLVALAMVQLCVVTVAEARIVKGTVACGKENLENVLVTDGKSFTETNSKGQFRLDVDKDAEFVYLVTPKGYVAPYESGVPAFYQKITEQKNYHFELLATTASEDYSIIAMADPQTAHEKHFALFQQNVMPDLLQTVHQQKKEFENTVGIVLGDIVWDNMDLMPAFKKEFVRTGIPMYPVIGNHDYLREAKGDGETASAYRDSFGPENYAYAIGDDYMIVLDNIVYDTQKQYEESLTADQLKWVGKLLEYIPGESHIWIGMHCPMRRWFSDTRPWLGKGQDLLALLGDRDYTVLTGHTHINNVLDLDSDHLEHNIAAACGTWWSTPHCSDGTPGGYKVFEKKDGAITWYYKSLAQPEDFQMEVFAPGESETRPNAVIANVWDYDSAWKVEWYQDGQLMGNMERVIEVSPYYVRELRAVYADKGKKTPRYKMPRENTHYFMAVPSQYAKEVKVVVTDRFGHRHEQTLKLKDYVDVQAHRGGAGLMPENTLESMKNALDLGVNTLELDLQLSQDGQIVVSHDPYFHSRYSTRPDGSLVQKGDPKEYLWKMPYEEIRKYDTGMRPGTNWPDKACLPTYKPLLTELLDFVENYTQENGLSPVRYNIEIKSRNGKDEGICWPEYHLFVDRCIQLLLSRHLGDRLVIQSFDVRALNYMHETYPQLYLSYLIDGKARDFDRYMSLLDFTPQWLSPHFSLVNEELCQKVWEKGMKLVPWTVDKPEDIQRMIDLGVDAIISNYPDRVLKATRGYVNYQDIEVR